jgi:hypothetical protein
MEENRCECESKFKQELIFTDDPNLEMAAKRATVYLVDAQQIRKSA